MAVEALSTLYTVPGIGQHSITAQYLHGDPGQPSMGRYRIECDGEFITDEVWHDRDDHWAHLMAKAAQAVDDHDRKRSQAVRQAASALAATCPQCSDPQAHLDQAKSIIADLLDNGHAETPPEPDQNGSNRAGGEP